MPSSFSAVCRKMVVPTPAHRRHPCPPLRADLNPATSRWRCITAWGVLPARPYKPRDKAKVESGVLVGRALDCPAPPAPRVSFPGRAQSGHTRAARPVEPTAVQKASRLARQPVRELDQPALRPLPAQPFELAEWRMAT